MNDPTVKQMYAKAIGELALDYLESQGCPAADIVESRAVAALSQIREILNDENLNDPDCFERIEAVVDAFYDAGIGTSRHDWG